MQPYPTSRDYDKLIRLMQAGHELVCFVDYSFPSDERTTPPVRDIARTRYEAPIEGQYDGHAYLSVSSRGIGYAGGLRLSEAEFKKDCQAVNLEFIPSLNGIAGTPARNLPAELFAIGEQLRTQDNRITQNPMFCVQIKRRDVGYDAAYGDQRCWVDGANDLVVYDDDKDFKEPEGDQWEEFGYKDRWETVMVAFTEAGCHEYLRLNGHNDRRRAHNGEVRIYVESFNRCPEMIALREFLMGLHPAASIKNPASS